MNACTATCSSGRPCTARARPARQYCFAHAPDRYAAARLGHFDGDPDDHVPELLVVCQQPMVTPSGTAVPPSLPCDLSRRLIWHCNEWTLTAH